MYPCGLLLPPSDDLILMCVCVQGKGTDEGTDTGDEANTGSNKRLARSFMGSFSKRKVILEGFTLCVHVISVLLYSSGQVSWSDQIQVDYSFMFSPAEEDR